MLNITGLNRFFFVRDFHDMRCKCDKVLSTIHQQLNREPEDGDVFIVMSKDLRLVRLFSYDRRSYSMFERRFRPGYQFMQVTHTIIFTCRMQGVSVLDYFKRFFSEIVKGRRDYEYLLPLTIGLEQ